MKDIFFFNAMLTPKIITFVYWLLLFMAVVSGIGAMFTGFGVGSILTGFLIVVAGAVGARIWCELLIVLFKIHENLKKLADRQP